MDDLLLIKTLHELLDLILDEELSDNYCYTYSPEGEKIVGQFYGIPDEILEKIIIPDEYDLLGIGISQSDKYQLIGMGVTPDMLQKIRGVETSFEFVNPTFPEFKTDKPNKPEHNWKKKKYWE